MLRRSGGLLSLSPWMTCRRPSTISINPSKLLPQTTPPTQPIPRSIPKNISDVTHPPHPTPSPRNLQHHLSLPQRAPSPPHLIHREPLTREESGLIDDSTGIYIHTTLLPAPPVPLLFFFFFPSFSPSSSLALARTRVQHDDVSCFSRFRIDGRAFVFGIVICNIMYH